MTRPPWRSARPWRDQVLGSVVHGVLHLGAEAAAQRHRLAGHRLAVEPGGAGRRHLLLDRKVGADGQGDAALAVGVGEGAELDDRARRAVAGGVKVRQPDVVGAAVDAVDHGIGGALQLVVEAAIDQAADDRIAQALAGEHIARGAAVDAALGEAAVDALDDVAALAKLPQGRLGGLRHHPLAGADLLGKAKDFELAQPADLEGVELVGLATGVRGKVDDAGAGGVACQLAVEIGPALAVDLTLEVAADVVVGARSQLLGDEVLGAGAHALP